jgi:Ca2+-binding RTX toxin-like protein
VLGTAPGTPVTLNTGVGQDTVTVGDAITTMDRVRSLTVHGNVGAALLLNDRASRDTTTPAFEEGPGVFQTIQVTPKFVIDSQRVTRRNDVTNTVASPTQTIFHSTTRYDTLINYDNLASLSIQGGSSHNLFTVPSTAAGTPVIITAGNATDAVNVGDPAGLLQHVNTLTVQGGTGTTLTLNDKANAPVSLLTAIRFGEFTRQTNPSYQASDHDVARTDRVIEIDPDGMVEVSNTSYQTRINYSGIASLTLNAGSSDDFVRVSSTASATAVTVNTGPGADDIFLGTGGNTIDQIRHKVVVNGQAGGDRLVVQDDLSPDEHRYTLTSNSIARDDFVFLSYSTVETLSLDAGRGDDVIFVESTVAGVSTIVNGGDGNDQFVSWDLDAIRGPVALHGQGGLLNYPLLYDYNNPEGQTYTLTADRVRRAGRADITFDNMVQLILFTSLTGADTVRVESVAFNVFTPIVLGIGDNIILGRPVPEGRTMQDILGTVRPQTYGNGPINVVVDNSGDLSPRQATFTYDPANLASGHVLSGLAPLPIWFQLNAVDSLLVKDGIGDDSFRLPAVLPTVPLTLDGGGGTNTLDYSAFTADVTVNLRTGTATGLSGFEVQNVTGGSANDILVGNDAANVLDGGAGRDILIGRRAADQLLGGADDDILIGGSDRPRPRGRPPSWPNGPGLISPTPHGFHLLRGAASTATPCSPRRRSPATAEQHADRDSRSGPVLRIAGQ